MGGKPVTVDAVLEGFAVGAEMSLDFGQIEPQDGAFAVPIWPNGRYRLTVEVLDTGDELAFGDAALDPEWHDDFEAVLDDKEAATVRMLRKGTLFEMEVLDHDNRGVQCLGPAKTWPDHVQTLVRQWFGRKEAMPDGK